MKANRTLTAAALVAASLSAQALTFALAGEVVYYFDSYLDPNPPPPVHIAWLGTIDVPQLTTQQDGTFSDLAWLMQTNVWGMPGTRGFATVTGGQVVSFGAESMPFGYEPLVLQWFGLSLVTGWEGVVSAGMPYGTATLTPYVSHAPEPATWVLLLGGVMALLARRRTSGS